MRKIAFIKINNFSRVIVFIIGGATFSEARCGYEISRDKENSWEVIVGRWTHCIGIVIIFLINFCRRRYSYSHSGTILVKCSTFRDLILTFIPLYLQTIIPLYLDTFMLHVTYFYMVISIEINIQAPESLAL